MESEAFKAQDSIINIISRNHFSKEETEFYLRISEALDCYDL